MLGAGAGADGWVRVLDDLGNGFAPLTWAQHGASGDGATWPAVCNLGTGGGLLLGGGDGSNGALELLDPGADYALLAVSPGLPGYSGRNYPACANLDTDPEWEILVGQGTGAQSTLVLLDKGVEPIMLQPGGDGSTWPALPGRIAHDEDGDQVSAPPDNCPAISNPDQSDTDTDGVGDACDDDADNDGVHDLDDNCPLRVNREQGDGDEDDIGDICPTIGNALQEDGDSDGVGDFCDADRDGDGMPNAYEERYPSTLDPDDPDDAFRDPDDDKRNNLAESRADTAPNNPADIPAPWLLGIGLGRGGMGAVDLQDLTANQALAWAQTSWSEYATDPNRGGIRPAWCNLDGDPGPELVLGFGRGSDGWLEILDQDPAGGYQSLAWYQVDWRAYNSANGESYPACGDLDGDGSDELIVGLGSGGKGWFLIVDAPLVAERKETWRQLDWVGYNNQNGELHPGTGNLDADGADEIVLGFGPGGGGWLRILDDAQSGYAPTHWTRYDYPTYNGANGTTWPVVCENAGRVELLIGADKGASGWLQRRDPAAGYAPVEDAYGDWLQLDWSVYNRDNGRVVPVCGDTDDDGYDEVGLATAQGGWMQLRDDTETGFAEIDWLQFKLPGERFYNGNTWPTLR